MQSLKSTLKIQQSLFGRRFFSSSGPNGRLIMVSHGPSEWQRGDPSNSSVNRFTGWVNIPLAEKGRERAHDVAELLSHTNIDCAITSQLSRTQETLDIILDEHHGDTRDEIPIVQSWRMNERHFGALVGLSRAEAERVYGADTLKSFRHDFCSAPPPMDPVTMGKWQKQNHCQLVTSISVDRDEKILEHGRGWCNSSEKMPFTESLADCKRRVLPFWEKGIQPRLAEGETVLMVGHTNIIKIMCSILEPSVISKESFGELKIPRASPIMYTFEKTGEDGVSVVPQKNEGDALRFQLGGEWVSQPIIDDEDDELDIA